MRKVVRSIPGCDNCLPLGKKEVPTKVVEAPPTTETKAPKKMAYTDVFAKALIAAAERDSRIVAITAAMPGGDFTWGCGRRGVWICSSKFGVFREENFVFLVKKMGILENVGTLS